MKRTLIYILIFTFGIAEYLPIPNLPEPVIEVIQNYSIFFPWIGIFIIGILRYFGQKRKYQIVFLLFLLFTSFFPMYMRDALNRVIIVFNDGRKIEETHNAIAGTKMNKQTNNVSYDWGLSLNEYESLIYQPNHGFKSDDSGREILEVINKNWYIQRTGLFE